MDDMTAVRSYKGLAKDEILGFISQFKGTENAFLHGLCYWFAFILRSRFECGDIVYDSNIGHFYWLYDGLVYDIEGAHSIPDSEYVLDYIRISDPTWYARIKRDCILKI